MKRQLFVMILVVAVLAGLALRFLLRPNPDRAALAARELATRILAEHLAGTQKGKRALIVSNPFATQKQTAWEIVETEDAGIRGLREGFGRNVAVGAIAYPELKPDAMANPRAVLANVETTTPLSYLVAPDAFDKLSAQHPDCEIIVSLVGLPEAMQETDSWKKEGAPRFAFLLPDFRVLGDATAVVKALKSGKLGAFVARKPNGVADSVPVKGDPRAEFDARFILVTPSNAEELKRATPSLF